MTADGPMRRRQGVKTSGKSIAVRWLLAPRPGHQCQGERRLRGGGMVQEFQVGEEAEVMVRDVFGRPAGTVRGRIVSLVRGADYFYVLLENSEGTHPIRLE